jgi:hypothetical protein
MGRTDISGFLIHFTKGNTLDNAFIILKKIIDERKILGSNTWIRGGYNCVCFSEAPLESLNDGLVNPDFYSKYSPFGIIVWKRWLFERGGRPVIYQSDDEFELLPETHKWRHMRYEPHKSPPIDFSWEREWRIHCDFLTFDHSVASIVVQDSDWANRLFHEHKKRQEWKQIGYGLIFDEDFAQHFCEPFVWNVICLRR